MTEIRLQNPYMDETIKLEWIEQGNMEFLRLHQIEPEDRVITISPKNLAKIDYYEVEEVEDEI